MSAIAFANNWNTTKSTPFRRQRKFGKYRDNWKQCNVLVLLWIIPCLQVEAFCESIWSLFCYWARVTPEKAPSWTIANKVVISKRSFLGEFGIEESSHRSFLFQSNLQSLSWQCDNFVQKLVFVRILRCFNWILFKNGGSILCCQRVSIQLAIHLF